MRSIAAHFVGWAAAVWLATIAVPAQAADCVPSLRILSSVPMQSSEDRTIMVVPVTIESSNKKLLLDTGGQVSQLSRATIHALDLPVATGGRELIDLAGDTSNGRATVRRLIVGAKEHRDVRLGVAPNPDLGTSLPYDGLLATDLFVDADLDMDFGARRLTAFSTEHCDGRVVYWPADNIAIVPISVKQNLITFPVTVNGQTLTAVMDTGAQHSVMNMRLANRLFGLGPDSPDMKPVTETSGATAITTYGHRFDDVAFEGVDVKDLRIYLMPDRPISRELTVPDLILGMDVLRHLHVYFATKEKRLYITDAVSGESALLSRKY